MGTGFQVLVLAHLICVIGGFGSLGYNGLYFTLARRRGGSDEAAVLDTNAEVSTLSELLIYGAFVFGIAAVASSDHAFSFSQGWVIAAIVLYLLNLGVLHGLIRPRQRAYRAASARLAATPPMAPPDRPPEIVLLDKLDRQISAGWGIFNVIVLLVLYLMVFTPTL